MNKRKKRSTKEIDVTIESLFRDLSLEYRVVAYIARKSPMSVVMVDDKWFSCKPLSQVVAVMHTVHSVLPKDSVMYYLKSSGYVGERGELEEVFAVYIEELYTTNISDIATETFPTMVEQLHRLYESRFCLSGIKRILRRLKSFNLDKVKDLFRRLARPISLQSNCQSGDYLEDFEERVQIIQDRADKRANDQTIGIPTGIARFDWLIGGVMRGEFGVVGGQPNIGKTTTLVDFAVHAWLAGYNVFFASGETDKSSIQFRIDSRTSRIAAIKFRTGDFVKGDFDRWQSQIDALRSSVSSFFEVSVFPRGFDMDVVRSRMFAVQQKKESPVHLLLLDYLNIAKPIRSSYGRSDKDWQSQASVVWDFKELVSGFNGGIVGWTAGQIRDEYFGADSLSLDALKYSRAIAETAPIVVGLVQSQDDILFNTLQFQVLKVREAAKPEQPILLYPNFSIMQIHQEPATSVKSLLEADVVRKRTKKRRRKSL